MGGCPTPSPHGLEAGAPQETLGALSCVAQQRGYSDPTALGGVGNVPSFHWLELSLLPSHIPPSAPRNAGP